MCHTMTIEEWIGWCNNEQQVANISNKHQGEGREENASNNRAHFSNTATELE